MRRFTLLAALTAIVATLIVVPLAQATSANLVSPRDGAIAQLLRHQGTLAADATPAQIQQAVVGYMQAHFGSQMRTSPTGRVMPANAITQAGIAHASLVAGSTSGPYVDKVLVILADFGTGGGPLNGEIPAPVLGDNSTFWPGDFSTGHYQSMLFGGSYPMFDAGHVQIGTVSNTMRRYYLEQSHGTYTVGGNVVDWVTLNHPESYYGADSTYGVDDLNGDVWRFPRDAVAALAAADPTFDWAQYDRENPWGIKPGGVNQPDGYIDHLIVIHAGVDESAGGGAQGSDAIWAHSWWIDQGNGLGPGQRGGYQIPGTNKWVGPYTVNPEDGGIGVFAHEFGHDLGLPDEYDWYSGGDTPSSFWTLMCDGSWLGNEWGLMSKPSDMNAWDKYFLGYVQPKVVPRGTTRTLTLDPAATGPSGSVSVKIPLPPQAHAISLTAPDGNTEWYSGDGDNVRRALTSKIRFLVPKSDPTLGMNTWFATEYGADWCYTQASLDGKKWISLNGDLTQPGGGDRPAMTGFFTSNWTDTVHFDLSRFAGKRVFLRFLYTSSPLYWYGGWEIDNIAVGGKVVGAALSSTRFAGWARVDGTAWIKSPRYYIAEYRARTGFDTTLANVYQFNPESLVNQVFWYPYNTGLHLIYRNEWYDDNNISAHPGEGGFMVVDAHPVPDPRTDGVSDWWRCRIQSRDASFSPNATADTTWLDWPYGAVTLPGKPAVRTFDDTTRTYFYPVDPDTGTSVQALGVRITVQSMTRDQMVISVRNGY
jgi:immune inhibitor A